MVDKRTRKTNGVSCDEVEKSVIVASYSYKQNVYHVETLKEFIDNSYDAAFVSEKTDFYMIGIFQTYEEANAFIESTRDLLSKGAIFELAAHTKQNRNT